MTETITPKAQRVYTMADRPADIDEKSWRLMIEQGVVESSNGEVFFDSAPDLFESEEEFDQFMAHIASIRAQKD